MGNNKNNKNKSILNVFGAVLPIFALLIAISSFFGVKAIKDGVGEGKTFIEKGEDGQDGIKGKNGTTWLNGDGIPSSSLGNNGNYYLNNKNNDYYYKKDGQWSKLGTFKGEKGESGKDGTDGNNGNNGNRGDDGSDGKDGKDGINTFSYTILSTENGEIIPSKGSCAIGESISFKFIPDSGYTLSSYSLDGSTYIEPTSYDSGETYIVETTMKEHGFVVDANFEEVLTTTHNLKAGTNSGGILSSYSDTTKVIFSDIVLSSIEENNADDLSIENDKSVLGIYDSGTKTYTITSNKEGEKITCPSMNYLFYKSEKITEFDFTNLDTSLTTEMAMVFGNCKALTSLDLTSFNTQNVISMFGMFYNCQELVSLSWIGEDFDTSNVRSFKSMFSGLHKVLHIDISKFNTSNATDMSGMFQNFYKLISITLGNLFNTSNVTNMSYMFAMGGESGSVNGKLKYIYVSSLRNVSNVTQSINMFYKCTELPYFDSSKVDKTNAKIGYGYLYKYRG